MGTPMLRNADITTTAITTPSLFVRINLSTMPSSITPKLASLCFNHDKGKNYNAIECVAAVAATLNVFEMGDTENTGERNRLCAQKHLQHIDHLVAGTEMELTPNPFAPWPRWPGNVYVEDAKKRAET
jgi:hypothetical protein